ncbi:MAG: fused MFS/spermidine synthase [Candidatus Rifleibacteriota bacterium]
MITLAYSAAIFIGSFLLFLVQPMIGKMLLPSLGGAPAVWTTCMLFFQLTLLAGYFYAKKSIKHLGCEKQSVIHLLLMILGLVELPVHINFSGVEKAFYNPISWLILKLLASIGFVFFIIAANAPLLQRWYSQTGQEKSHDPYFLYSASNAGSLLGLISFPFFFEPQFKLSTLGNIWSVIYVIQVFLVFFCALSFWGEKQKAETGEEKLKREFYASSVSLKSAFKWAFWGFIPCSAMLAVTTHLATDIISGPLLWVFPLAIYLLSFILVFSVKDRYRRIDWDSYFFPMGTLIIIMYFFSFTDPAWYVVCLQFTFLFLLCMSFHARLANDRPVVEHLNEYYFWMSVGGVLGGIFNGIVAPAFFKAQLEYMITIIIAVLAVCFTPRNQNEKSVSILKEAAIIFAAFVILYGFAFLKELRTESYLNVFGFFGAFCLVWVIHFFFKHPKTAGLMLMVGCYSSISFLMTNQGVLFRDRSFFGILKVERVQNDGDPYDPDLNLGSVQDIFYCLAHGNTLHGVERKVEVRPLFPLTYYSREGPVGDIFKLGNIKRWAKKVGIVGLGCGTIAYYGRPWQQFDFFEINPAVIKIATDKRLFTYLDRCAAKTKIIAGDARIMLERLPDSYYDLLIMDAYTSDSVPTHLLTMEAFRIYMKKLKPDGMLVLHLSNRYFKLDYVVARILQELKIPALIRRDDPRNYSIKYDWYDEMLLSRSIWIAASNDKHRLEGLKSFGDWQKTQPSPAYSVWTDDYANILQIYNWR